MSHPEILNTGIQDLPFSNELKGILIANGIATLNDLLQLASYQWHKNIPGFNYHDQHEIINYLTREKLMEFLKED